MSIATLARSPRWAALVLLAGLATPPAKAQTGAAYLRTVEGYVEHARGRPGGVELLPAAVNTPLGVGDRLRVSPDGRVEAVLADGSLLRLGGDSEVVIAALARSLEGTDPASAIDLERGALQLTRPAYAGPESLEVRLRAATVYLEAPGAYRVSSDGWGRASVTVREGFAEVATAQGSSVVRASETAWLDGLEAPRLDLTQALARDDLELWADDLDAAARTAAVPYVEESIAYAAAPLADYGGWVEVSGRPGWQPYAADDWRPYAAGSWSYGPGGLNWISAEPWGWVTSHYGAWDYLPGFGWVWFPGEVYAPAWVTWYWGPTHVGWVPAGVTLSALSGFGTVSATGVYGWVGGSWSDSSLWSFCRLEEFGRRSQRDTFSSGAELARDTRSSAMPPGLLATDTRSLTPELWRDRPSPLGGSRPTLLRPSGTGPTSTRPHLLEPSARPGIASRPPMIVSRPAPSRTAAASASRIRSGPSGALAPRPVVRRVVEDIRATRQGLHPPAASTPRGGSWRTPNRPSQNAPRSSEPPSRGTTSSRKPPQF